MKGRTVNSVKTRYHTLHREKLHSRPWEPSEDRLVIEKRIELGKRWAAIAKCIKDRSATVVRKRWQSLFEGSIDLRERVLQADKAREEKSKRSKEKGRARTKSLKKRPVSESATPGRDPKRTSLKKKASSLKKKKSLSKGRRSSVEIVQAAAEASARRRSSVNKVPDLFVPDWIDEEQSEILPDRKKGLFRQSESVNILAGILGSEPSAPVPSPGTLTLTTLTVCQTSISILRKEERELVKMMKNSPSTGTGTSSGSDKDRKRRVSNGSLMEGILGSSETNGMCTRRRRSS